MLEHMVIPAIIGPLPLYYLQRSYQPYSVLIPDLLCCFVKVKTMVIEQRQKPLKRAKRHNLSQNVCVQQPSGSALKCKNRWLQISDAATYTPQEIYCNAYFLFRIQVLRLFYVEAQTHLLLVIWHVAEYFWVVACSVRDTAMMMSRYLCSNHLLDECHNLNPH